MKTKFKIIAAAILACLAVMHVKADSLNVHVVSGTDVASNINIYKNGNVVSSIVHAAWPYDVIDFNP